MKPRPRQAADATPYRATREPPEQPHGADPRDVPYPVTLMRDETDAGGWVATIDVLPGCNARGATPDEALERVAVAVAEWVETAEREGKEVPEPKSAQSHSGRLLLRMPQTLHAELARAAERENVSLNQFISDALSGSLGWRSEDRQTPRGARAVPPEGFDAIDSGPDGQTTAQRGWKSPRFATSLFVANVVIVALAAIVAIIVLIAALR